METVDDVLDGLESGVQHALQAGIDRVNQHAKTLSHEIKDWRIMPNPFTYAVIETLKILPNYKLEVLELIYIHEAIYHKIEIISF